MPLPPAAPARRLVQHHPHRSTTVVRECVSVWAWERAGCQEKDTVLTLLTLLTLLSVLTVLTLALHSLSGSGRGAIATEHAGDHEFDDCCCEIGGQQLG